MAPARVTEALFVSIFFGSRFSENQDSEISQLLGESTVWINRVFGNPDYFDPIL
jgi:hypothetical protein